MAFGILIHEDTIERGGWDLAGTSPSAHMSADRTNASRLDPFLGCQMACENHLRDSALSNPGSTGCKVALFNEATMQCFLYMKGVSGMTADSSAPGVFSNVTMVADLGADSVSKQDPTGTYAYPHPGMYMPCVESPIKVKCSGNSCEIQWMAGQDTSEEQHGYEKVEWINAPPANTVCTNAEVSSVVDNVGGTVEITPCGTGTAWSFKNPAKYSCWAKSEACKTNVNCS